MPQVNIKKLISKLEKRDDNGASKEFIRIFGNIVKDYIEYEKWVKMMIKKNGSYHGCIDILDEMTRSLRLFTDIRENGLKEPIVELLSKEGIEIDGYHRLVIMNLLGHKEICAR